MALVLSVALRRRVLPRTAVLVVLVLVVVLWSTIRRIVTRSTTVRLLVLRRIAGTSVSGLLSIAWSAAVATLLRRRRILVVTASTIPRLVVARRRWSAVARLREAAWLMLRLAVLAVLARRGRRVVVLAGSATVRASRLV